MNPIVVQHNALLVASVVGGLCTSVAVIASALRKRLPFHTDLRMTLRFRLCGTGPARLSNSQKAFYPIRSFGFYVITALARCSFSAPQFERLCQLHSSSYHKHLVCHSSSFPPPSGPRRRPCLEPGGLGLLCAASCESSFCPLRAQQS